MSLQTQQPRRSCVAVTACASKKRHKKVLSPTHERYATLLSDDRCSVVAATGPAGTGKTFIACGVAVSKLLKKQVSRVILTRPAVCPEGEEHGFLPGDLDAKMKPYMIPLLDAFRENGIGTATMNKMLKEGSVEICPLAFMRGRTFRDCYVIADEAQNATPEQMRMLLTRAGEGCKIVITGDVSQCDLSNVKCRRDGLSDLLYRIERRYESSDEIFVDVVSFTEADIIRSVLAQNMIRLYA